MNTLNPTTQLDRITAELRRLGLLADAIPPALPNHSAFGMAQMPFELWLVQVFLPRAYEAAAKNQWPAASQAGMAAIRQLDGRDEYDALITLLCEFDRMVVEAYNRQAGERESSNDQEEAT